MAGAVASAGSGAGDLFGSLHLGPGVAAADPGGWRVAGGGSPMCRENRGVPVFMFCFFGGGFKGHVFFLDWV